MEEPNPLAAVEEILEQPDRLRDLDLDVFAEELKRQKLKDRPRFMDGFASPPLSTSSLKEKPLKVCPMKRKRPQSTTPNQLKLDSIDVEGFLHKTDNVTRIKNWLEDANENLFAGRKQQKRHVYDSEEIWNSLMMPSCHASVGDKGHDIVMNDADSSASNSMRMSRDANISDDVPYTVNPKEGKMQKDFLLGSLGLFKTLF